MSMEKWQAKIEWRDSDKVTPYARNSKKHTTEQIDKIAGQIHAVGFTQPILVDKDYIVIAGHGRLEAARRLNMKRVPVVVADHLDEFQVKAARIADNKVAEAEWDFDMLKFELGSLDLGDFDMKQTGFEPDEISAFLQDGEIGSEQGKALNGDEDEVPEPRKKPRAKLGEIYLLGSHRLMCGDSTKTEDVSRLFGKDKATMWASDPPYGISYVDGVANEKGQAKGYEKIANDDLEDEALKEFIQASIETSLPFMAKGFAFYMWHAMKMQAYFSQAAAAAAAGILFHRQIIWVKPNFVFGRGQYHWRHELCLMGWLKGNEPPFYGERNQSTVWEIARENDKIHPTQKPVAIWEPGIRNHTKTGDIIYEPFAGSGSNLIACEKFSRRSFSMELDPVYVGVIIDRWEKLSCGTATREDGTPWSEIEEYTPESPDAA